jgi:hypothetical protein
MVTNSLAQMINPVNSLLGPDVTQQQYQLQQNQRYADMLMQQAMQEPAQGQMVSGHYVPPSPVQGLAQLLKAYVGRKASDMIPEQQTQLANAQNAQIQKMFGLGGEVAPAQASGMALGGGALQGDVGPTTGNASRMQGVQNGTVSAMPIPSGMDNRAAMLQYMIDPKAYATALGSHSTPTEFEKIAKASGLVPGSQAYAAAMQGQLGKQNYIAPTIASEGAAVIPAGSNMPTYIAPKNGIAMQNTPQGFQANPVPGYANATGTIEQAQAYGKGLGGAQTTPAEKFNPDTGQYEATTQAANMGLPTPGMPQQNMASGKPVITKPSATAQEAGKELNSNWIKTQLEPAQMAGEAAQKNIDSIRVLRSTNLDTGFGTDAKAAAAGMLAAFGVKDAEKYATNAQVFKTEISRKLMDTMAAQKGVQSESDFKNIKQTEASLANTPQANTFIFDLAEAKAEQDMRKAAYFSRAAEFPELRNNLPSITNEWRRIEGSIFAFPSMQKYKVK